LEQARPVVSLDYRRNRTYPEQGASLRRLLWRIGLSYGCRHELGNRDSARNDRGGAGWNRDLFFCAGAAIR
jgi:hypothetical protein